MLTPMTAPGPPTLSIVDIYQCCGECEPKFVVDGACLEETIHDPLTGIYYVSIPGFGDVLCEVVGQHKCTFDVLHSVGGVLVPGWYYGCADVSAHACEVQADGDTDVPELLDGYLTCSAASAAHLQHEYSSLASLYASWLAAVETACGQNGSTYPDYDGEITFNEYIETGVDDDSICDLEISYSSFGIIDLIFRIDPDLSSITFEHSSLGSEISTLDGILFASSGSESFLAGAARGESVTWDGITYNPTSAGFVADIHVDVGAGTLTVPAGQLDAIWWEGLSSNGNARVAYAIAPSEDAAGTFSATYGLWHLGWTDQLGPYTIEVELGGTWTGTSPP